MIFCFFYYILLFSFLHNTNSIYELSNNISSIKCCHLKILSFNLDTDINKVLLFKINIDIKEMLFFLLYIAISLLI